MPQRSNLATKVVLDLLDEYRSAKSKADRTKPAPKFMASKPDSRSVPDGPLKQLLEKHNIRISDIGK